MVESKWNPEWSDDSEEEERKARGTGSGAIRSATFIEQQQYQVSSIQYYKINMLINDCFQNFGQQQFDFSNKKQTDGNINDMLYSGGDIGYKPSNKMHQPMVRN